MTRLAFAAALLAFSLPAHAGVILRYEDDQKKQTTIELDGNRMRTESHGAGDNREHGAIFDGDKHVFYILDGQDKSYRRLDEASAAQVADRMKTAMDAAKARMTPEQRANMEAMMARRQARTGADRAQQHTWTFERAAGGERVAGYACDNYRVIHDGKVESEACFVPWRGGPVQKDDFQAFREMGRFLDTTYAGMTRGLGQGAQQGPSNAWMARMIDDAPGFPAVLRELKDGKPAHETRLVKLDRSSVAASRFTPPADYREIPMMKGAAME